MSPPIPHWKRIMVRFFDWLKVGAGALLGALVAYQVGHWRGEEEGRQAEQVAARTRAMDLIEKRRLDDAEISSMDIARLCAELGGRWVPNDDRCD
jgi:hypothetical protein